MSLYKTHETHSPQHGHFTPPGDRKEVHGLNDICQALLLCHRAFGRHGAAEGEAYGADLPFLMGAGLSQGRAELRYALTDGYLLS